MKVGTDAVLLGAWSVLSMNNVFNLSFFEDNKLFEKCFEFQKNSIHKQALKDIPLMSMKGVLAT